MDMDEVVWNHAVFSKNRERLLNEEVAEVFFQRVLERAKPYLSDEHFTVDGTLIEAWASHKSFRPKDGGERPSANGREVDFHGERRSNETHQSTTDPDARLYKKSQGSEAKMGYLGHALMENRHGLLVDTMVTLADGTAERDAALLMASQIPGVKPVTLGGDKNYDTQELVRDLRDMKVTPHVAQNNTNRRSAIDGRTTQHPGYAISQKKRKRIEESFGWMKTIGMLKKVKGNGLPAGENFEQDLPVGRVVVNDQHAHIAQNRGIPGNDGSGGNFLQTKACGEMKTAALAGFALHPNSPVHESHQPGGNGKAESGAAIRPAHRSIRLRECFEDC